MKAVVRSRYGPPEVLQLQDVERPTPRAHEVRIRVHASAVTSGDCKMRSFKHIPIVFWLPARIAFGVVRPKHRIPGSQLAGEIESVGSNVSRFRAGDRVFGSTGLGLGAYAEYVCLPEDAALAPIAAKLTYEEAAAIPFGALTALFFFGKAQVKAGDKVLVNGAAGAVGTAAIQLAKSVGAAVTGVCSTGKLDLVRSLGADVVIDYTEEDFSRNAQRYDVIFDTVGTTTFSRCKGSLEPNGRYLLTVFGLPELAQMLWTSVVGGKRVICGMAPERPKDLVSINELVEAGKMRPVIDRRFPLEQTAQAHRYVETGHKAGNVVITVAD